jgi:hypothetical protein
MLVFHSFTTFVQYQWSLSEAGFGMTTSGDMTSETEPPSWGTATMVGEKWGIIQKGVFKSLVFHYCGDIYYFVQKEELKTWQCNTCREKIPSSVWVLWSFLYRV